MKTITLLASAILTALAVGCASHNNRPTIDHSTATAATTNPIITTNVLSAETKAALRRFLMIPDSTPETFMGGAKNLELVNTAKAIKVFRIVDPDQKLKPKKTINIDNCQCHASPVNVTGPEVQQVIAAMSDMINFGEPLMCIFDPGIILRFESDAHNLDVIICFHCHEMVLYSDGVVVRRPFKWAATKNTFRPDAESAFMAIAKKAFPGDPEIQKLK